MRVLAWLGSFLLILWLGAGAAWCQESPVADAAEVLRLDGPGHRWTLAMEPDKGVFHFGLDSEGTGREQTNLLSGPLRLAWPDAGNAAILWQASKDGAGPARWRPPTTVGRFDGRSAAIVMIWLWRLAYEGKGEASGISLTLPLNSLIAPTVALPGGDRCAGPRHRPLAHGGARLWSSPRRSEPADGWTVVQDRQSRQRRAERTHGGR